MALFVKQDFNPPILSKKWCAMRFRPNMLIYSHQHILTILESGLLFREDSIAVEQEAGAAGDLWEAAGDRGGGWLTRGEKGVAAVAVCAAVAIMPPRSLNQSTLAYLAAYLSLPVSVRAVHRYRCRGASPRLVDCMRDYLTLARRAAACVKEFQATRAQLDSASSLTQSVGTLLCRQQSEMAIAMSRATSALLGNIPWLRGDLAWDAIDIKETDNLMKIHHAFLVVQSTLLKYIAMAHFVPSPQARKIYKNHNERIYWLHHSLIEYLTEQFTQNLETLERMYRLLKNYGTADQKEPRKLGDAVKDNWLYSDIHNDIARTNLELKISLNKCNDLDLFLDSCALHKQELDLEILNNDIDKLIDHITKSLSSAQSSQIRLKKLLSKFTKKDEVVEKFTEFIEEEKNVLKIEDREPEIKDEVFYFVNTDDGDKSIQPCGDVITAPGKKEKETTKLVLNELRRKLVKREDGMRERERQALAKTMPDFKDKIPEFERQMKLEDFSDRNGYILKLRKLKKDPPKKPFRQYKIQSKPHTRFNYRLQIMRYESPNEIAPPIYKANAKLKADSKILTFAKEKNNVLVINWHRKIHEIKEIEFSELSEGLSDVESAAVNKNIHQAVNVKTYKQDGGFVENQNGARNYKFSKRDLEVFSSSGESDMEFAFGDQEMLRDVRRHRPLRKKNYPNGRGILNPPLPPTQQDEGLKPAPYSLGAGLAMASVLQVQSSRLPTMAQEEIFIGDGEVSEDSGNDEDA